MNKLKFPFGMVLSLSIVANLTLVSSSGFATTGEAPAGSLNSSWSADSMTPQRCEDFMSYYATQRAAADTADQYILELQKQLNNFGVAIYEGLEPVLVPVMAVSGGIDFYTAILGYLADDNSLTQVRLFRVVKISTIALALSGAVYGLLSVAAKYSEQHNKPLNTQIVAKQQELKRIRATIFAIEKKCNSQLGVNQ